MADEDGTTFQNQFDPNDSPQMMERRAHAWKDRTRMAWWCMFGVIVSMFVPLAISISEIGGRVIENGQWVLGVALLSFIGGKAAVEGFVAVKGPRT